MALILNIETATSVCSVALSRDGKVIACEESHEANVHAEKLTVFIQDILKKNSVPFKELDAIAVGTGPGSYTGLRIGTSVAKGLCYALEKPMIAIPTLKAMATEAAMLTSAELFCPMIDARRLEVYTGLYDKAGKEVMPVQAMILDENSFSEQLNKHTIAFMGDGMPKLKTLLSGKKNVLWLDDIYASAKNMAGLSEAAFNNKQFADLAYYEPFYLKDFVAKAPKKL
jgi:tRNA threonylcarbamoyladenosine biosynthesis protein TsaB